MSQQIIDISTPDDGLGDVLRTGFDKTNQNFTELYNGKVDKITGKGLSENDFTDANKTKLDGIEEGAEVNVQADWGETDPLADSFIQNKPPNLYSAVGYFHYADLATQTTPISITADTDTLLTNDTLGDRTFKDQAPYGISDVWYPSAFDFSQLSVGDTLDLRVDLLLTTTSANQKYKVFLRFAEGFAEEFDLEVCIGQIKTATTDQQIIGEVGFSIDLPRYLSTVQDIYIISDDTASVKVNGWYIRVLRKSVNIVDFNSDPLKQDIVNVISSNTTAVNNQKYNIVANATFTDPSPIEGRGYEVFVRNGIATIGGVAYPVGSYVFRTFHSGSWSTQLIGGGGGSVFIYDFVCPLFSFGASLFTFTMRFNVSSPIFNPIFEAASYNWSTDNVTNAGITAHPVISNQKIKKIVFSYNTISTSISIRLVYFKVNQTTGVSFDNVVIFQKTLTTSSNIKRFSIDLPSEIEIQEGGFVSFVLFNNNVACNVTSLHIKLLTEAI